MPSERSEYKAHVPRGSVDRNTQQDTHGAARGRREGQWEQLLNECGSPVGAMEVSGTQTELVVA